MDFSLPEEHFQRHISAILKEVLQGRETHLSIKDFTLKEESNAPWSLVEFVLLVDDCTFFLSGSGEGMTDALFTALADHFSPQYLCLENVEFEDFRLKAAFKDGLRAARTDAPVEITLALKTNRHARLYFRAHSHSLAMAAVEVVRTGIEFLINCEKAVIELYSHLESLKAAKKEHLQEPYVLQLADIVKLTSFEKTIQRLKWQTSPPK